jgi:hypothetical protein
MSRCTYLMFLTGPFFAMAEILSGFALMPCSVIMYPRIFPWGTRKVHFLGVQLNVESAEIVEVSSKLEMRL